MWSNFMKFPNSEVGTSRLRLLVTGVEVELKVELEVNLGMFETPYCHSPPSLAALSQQ